MKSEVQVNVAQLLFPRRVERCVCESGGEDGHLLNFTDISVAVYVVSASGVQCRCSGAAFPIAIGTT